METAGSPSLPSLPLRRSIRGPVSRSRLRRAGLIYAAGCVFGTLPLILGFHPAWRAVGLGLWFPGAGFLYAASPFLFVVTPVLFVAALMVWVLWGPVLLPPLIWLGAAMLAGLVAQPGHVWSWAWVAIPLLVIGLVARSQIKRRQAEAESARNAVANRALLAKTVFFLPETRYLDQPELTEEDLGALRFALDLMLQPIEKFDGFVHKDQFREAAYRYPLVKATWALAMLQTTRLPAFGGYISESQRNAMVKMTDRRVWSYWRWENLWGNFKFNPDPIIKENVMYSGF